MQELKLLLKTIQSFFYFNVLKTAWCRGRKIAKGLHEMTNSEPDKYLRHFYAEARTKDGVLYSRSSLLKNSQRYREIPQ